MVVAVPQGRLKVFLGSKGDDFARKYILNTYKGETELKGRVASRGKARGVAKVIFSGEDFKKLGNGEILVVTNTSPDFVSIMRKAGAIVAEEGGLTAHVSVVSREFGIPCIVGIANATDILKDGDLIEVDAEKGVVRIIERA